MALPVVLPALACSVVATAVGGVFLGRAPTYTGLPDYPFLPAELVWAALAGPVIGLVVLELTHVGFGLVLPMTVAVVVATAVARWVDGYSIYSARLSTISP
jgi:H+/Cl- antiporter ClcA